MYLYKYRSLGDWKYLLDIFSHRRLYAALYSELNDPMEGYYRFATGGKFSQEYERSIRKAKTGWFVCSLSERPLSTLMWSYYSDGHKGIAIGVQRPTKHGGRRVEKIHYDNTFELDGKRRRPVKDVAVDILSKKLWSWRHEQEYRVFSREQFVPVRIREVLLGCKIRQADEELLRTTIGGLCPDVAIRKLKVDELEEDYAPEQPW